MALRVFQFILIGLLLSISFLTHATHNRAGEITFEHIQGYRYKVKLTTYTDPNSPPDREKLKIYWDDGTASDVNRQRIDANIGEENRHPVDRNIYIAEHTFPGPGTYTIRMRDRNRVENIVNMQDAINTAFYVESKLKIFPGGRGNNSSPKLLQPPIDYAQKGEVFVHYPNAYDVNGDSLAYSFVPPKRAKGEEVRGYYLPYAENNFSIESRTGRVEWDHPDTAGIYNIAIKVEEFRQGRKIGEVIRDMQIIVTEGQNKRPRIPPFKDTCIKAGSELTLDIPIAAFDTNRNQAPGPGNQETTISATGGPFEVSNNKAEFSEQTSSFQVNSRFTWEVSCNHIQRFPYQVVFKAKDDHPRVPMADLQHLRIRVIGPEPQNLTSDPQPKGIGLNWDKPSCKNVRGYYVYRKVDTSAWSPDRCETGVPGYTGFQRVDTIIDPEKTSYFDDKAVPGTQYCYRVTGIYINQDRYNWTEGYTSNQTCDRLKKDIPVITHVDVRETDVDTGAIFVDWTKPLELDSNTYEPPYAYKVYRSTGMGDANNQLVKTIGKIQSFNSLIDKSSDTFHYDSSLNTKNTPYSYNIALYASSDSAQDDVFVGESRNNSSVYLSITPDHKMLRLSWQSDVLWNNTRFVIFRKSFREDSFSAYDTVTDTKYADTQLVKDSTYAYYIKTIGSFSASGFPEPIINHSQINQNEPIDTIPPCPPQLNGQANCAKRTNQLNWNKPVCRQDSNVRAYQIYYRDHRGKTFQSVAKKDYPDSTAFIDNRQAISNSIAGCYAVTALDKYGNESDLSNGVCMENCPEYKLPNVFTPNDDGVNDHFRPKKGWQFVDRIRFKVYNRWGQLVYETTDPEIMWDGTDKDSGNDLSAGTYFYDATIFLNKLEDEPSITKSGTIQLIR